MFEAGTVVLIPFPYSDLSNAKKRPVLMLTPPDSQGDFVAMPLTSQSQPLPALKIDAGPLPLGGNLPFTSWIKVDTVFSLCESEIIKAVGRVANESRKYCVQQLCLSLNKGL